MLLSEDKVKKHLGGVQSSLSWATVEPFMWSAEQEFSRLIGAPLAAYLASAQADADLKRLAEACCAWQGLVRALPYIKIRIGDMGLMKASPANTVAITKWEYIDTVDGANREYDNYLEAFFERLEDLRPQAWTSSPAYARRRANFIQGSDEMAVYTALASGRNSRLFDKLVPYISRAELLYIRPALTEAFFSELKTRWRDPDATWTALETALLEAIKQAVAPLAYFEALPYMPLLLDHKGVASLRSKDGILEEINPSPDDTNTMRRQLFQDGQLFLGQLKTLLSQAASPTVFTTYYLATLPAPPAEPEDFTDKSLIIL